MNNLDRGELLCRLFPQELQNMLDCIAKQCDYFLENENKFRTGWQQHGFFTAAFWYSLVQDAHKRISSQRKQLAVRPRWFSEQFFDGYDALFTVHCLIEYADTELCDFKLRLAIHLLFGDEKMLLVTSGSQQ